MPFFDAVCSSGVHIAEDLINEAKKLVLEIGPYVEDPETLKLICLMQIMSPPKKWSDKVGSINIILLFIYIISV